MPGYTYSVMERIPESELVRIGFRKRDFLESYACRSCSQKVIAACIPFMLSFVYYKEYQQKYGHYPFLRSSFFFGKASLRQKIHYLVPIAAFSVGFWWVELAYNRCALGIQGAEPLPDQLIAKE
mmetsp:Transcript_329/g.583  ORF Transcript_329/g.583 Transcript_329/m.583 type:complete len:124 (+) Transcript_329:1206-1577(+)